MVYIVGNNKIVIDLYNRLFYVLVYYYYYYIYNHYFNKNE
jgi:hypothetical protein